MNTAPKKILILATTALVLGGCSATILGQQASTEDRGFVTTDLPLGPVTEPVDSLAFEYYVNGLLFEGLQDHQNAAASFELAWGREPESTEIGLAYAGSLVQLRNYSGALDALDRMATTDADVLDMKALCFRRLRDPERAHQTYLDLIKVDPENQMAYMYLADDYRRQADLDSTIWALTRLEAVMPNRYEVTNEMARLYVARGDTEKAKLYFRKSLDILPAPANGEAMKGLTEIFASAGHSDSTLALYEDAVKRYPADITVNQALADYWVDHDSPTEALTYLAKLANLDPQDKDNVRRLALTYMSLDLMAEADSVFSALIVSGDDNPLNHYYLGRIAIVQQDYERARDELTGVARVGPPFADVWLALGFVHRQLGQPEQEIDTYRSGLLHMTEESTAVQLYFALGAAFEQANMIDSAVSTLEELLEHQPDHAPTLNYLGYTLADRNLRLDYAKELIGRALEMHPDNVAYLDSYGWVYYRLGDFKEAVKYLKRAAELDSDPVIYDHLGDAYNAAGKNKKARQWWEKALQRKPDDQTIQEKLNR